MKSDFSSYVAQFVRYPNYLRDAEDGLLEPIRLNNPVVFAGHYNGDLNIMIKGADKLFEKIGKAGAIALERGPAKSTAPLADKPETKEHQPHLMEEFNDFFKFIQPRIREVLNRHTYPKDMPYYISKSWVNEHFKDGETLEHVHGTTTIVISFYLTKTLESGNIWFRDPDHQIRAHEFSEQSSYAWREIPAISGDFILFPGWLPHKTGVSFSDERRIVLTANIMADEKEYLKNVQK